MSSSQNPPSWPQTAKLAHQQRRPAQARRFRSSPCLWYPSQEFHAWSRHTMVQSARYSARLQELYDLGRYMVGGLYFRRNHQQIASFPRTKWRRSAQQNLLDTRYSKRRGVARVDRIATLWATYAIDGKSSDSPSEHISANFVRIRPRPSRSNAEM